MSIKSKGQIDLVEDITVEELLADGLVEDVEVSGEEQGKKKLDDKEDTADAPVANAVPSSAPEADPVKPEFDAVGAAVSAAPVAMAPHAQGVPEAPALAPDVKKAADSVDAAIAAAPEAEVPQTKAGLINAMYQHLSTMKTEDLASVYSTLTAPKETPEDEDPAADAEDDSEEKMTAEPKEYASEDAETPEASDEKGEDEKKEKEEDDEEEVKEGLDVLLQAEKSLSEAFRSKASSLFESAVKTKLAKEVSRIEENYQTQLEEEVTKVASSLSEKVDSYLSYVVKTWMEENKVAIESGLRSEIAENFIAALKNVFKESYIEVPEGKENLVDTLTKNVASLEGQLMKATESNMKLNESVGELKRKQILAEASVGLASTEAVKLNSLTAEIDFEDAETFTKKVRSIKESFFRKVVKAKVQTEETVALNESGSDESLTPLMAAYSSAITRTIK
jgi:hypothetical protein